MFKRAVAILVIVCLQALGFAGILATLGFQLNRNYIASSLCENKAKPQMHCKGKCYMKKMQKEAERQKQAGENVLKDFSCILCETAGIAIPEPVEYKIDYLSKNNNFFCKGWPSQFSPPPAFSV